MSYNTKKTIKLYCPSLSKLVHFFACEFEQKLDLGAIALAFELDPHSLKLNGHFISRGVDLIASSVTWNSLLSFFSARGLPTGLSGSGPLIVHGKLLYRLGTKRRHVPENTDIGAMNKKEYGFDCLDRRLLAADPEVVNAKRLKDNNSGCSSDGKDDQISSSLKRRSLYEDQSSLKRTRTNGSYLGEDNHISSSLKRRSPSEDQSSLKRTRTNGTDLVAFKRIVDLSNNNNNAIGSSQLSCSFISQNMKREREDEMLIVGPSKRLK
ncbi:hypothetical protein Leryth_000828 [Lithospermum erythrorhizon]|nr:hypothetical protein Leryth_000828 [Lithospermum erythrorhizon]